MTERAPLAAAELCPRCDPSRLPFETTADLADLEEAVGQDRAVEALRFGIGMRRPGHHVFVLGSPGSGQDQIVERLLAEDAARRRVPSDVCYVQNFAEPERPKVLLLPPGRGKELRAEMRKLLEALEVALRSAFESEHYRTRKQLLEREHEERHEKASAEVQRRAEQRGLAAVRTPTGILFAPLEGGEVMSPEKFRELPAEKRERYQKDMAELGHEVEATLQEIPRWASEHREKLEALRQEVAQRTIENLLSQVEARWSDQAPVLAYLAAVRDDVIENTDALLAHEDEESAWQQLLTQAPRQHRYQVNLVVDRSELRGSPVVTESRPTLPNLVGRVEQLARFGTLVSDFTLIRAGALHRANGGALVLEAGKLLAQPFAYEHLKSALKAGEIRIESVGQALSLQGPSAVDPEPVPLDVKVVMIGERRLYYLLAALDPEFAELFKVAADLDDQIERTDQATLGYARRLATIARHESLRPLDRGGVARVIDHAARLTGDAQRLTGRVERLADVVREADHIAAVAGHSTIQASDVDAAIAGRIRRSGRMRDRIQEAIRRGTIRIDLEGERVGQVNGLSVVELGDFAFGHPTRITARARLGDGEVVDVEREVELGGPIHSKGVLILTGLLGARYCPDRPLSLHATIVFEQQYGGVEGDSASAAELCALLSAISDVPLRQSLAITGSIDQHGRVQAIGGVNEKIEGFFDACRAAGRTDGGVLVPRANLPHLMLRADVVEAVASGTFRVWAIDTIDDAMELLTGLPAGVRDELGRFTEDSLNARVEQRLMVLSEAGRSFSRGAPWEK